MTRLAARLGGLLAIACITIAQAAPPAKPAGPPKGWRVYKAPQNGFTVWLPQKGGQQANQTLTLRIRGSNPLKVDRIRYTPNMGPIYGAGIVHLPKVLIGQITGTKWLELFRDAYLEEGKAKLMEQKEVNLGQFPGREFLIKGMADTTRLRVYVAEKQLYLLTIEGKPEEMNTDEATTFLGSYKVPGLEADLATKDKEKEKEKPKGILLDTATVMKLVEALKSADATARQGAAEKLAKAAPLGPRDEVAKALVGRMVDESKSVQDAVKKALMVWGGKDHVPALLPLLRENSQIRGNTMEVLAVFKDERGAEAVAERLRNSVDRAKASQALQAMGPVAEPAALKQLKYPDAKVRLEACKVLEVVGTKASLAALKAAAQDSNVQVVKAAQQAAEKVAKR